MKDPDIYDIRFAYIPIYDCYWFCLVATANACEIDLSKLNYANLKQSWREIRDRLEEKTSKKEFHNWNQIINEISGFRNVFAHDPSGKYPTIQLITKWVDEIQLFSNWLPNVIRPYIENLPSYRAALTFNGVIENYIWKAEFVFREIGAKTTPRIVKDNYLFAELFKYQELPRRIEEVREIMIQLTNITELTQLNFEKIVKLIRYISLLEGSHHASLELYKCPICDGTIEEISTGYGGTEWDPEPSGVGVRTGCDSCNYTVYEDSF